MSMDENDWIEKVLQGDAAAYERLVRKYQARLVAFLWNLLGNGDDARDAAQDSFIQAYVRLDRFDRTCGFKPWLFAIAYNHGIDLLRRRNSFHRFWQHQAEGSAPPPAAGSEESILWLPLLRKTTPQERTVLALKYNEDCGNAEIAALLGCTESTVRVHLLNARRKLKKELHAAGFAAGPGKSNAEEAT
jgi:RNA polymerase sigma-70 factor (ECF subfamily)